MGNQEQRPALGTAARALFGKRQDSSCCHQQEGGTGSAFSHPASLCQGTHMSHPLLPALSTGRPTAGGERKDASYNRQVTGNALASSSAPGHHRAVLTSPGRPLPGPFTARAGQGSCEGCRRMLKDGTRDSATTCSHT